MLSAFRTAEFAPHPPQHPLALPMMEAIKAADCPPLFPHNFSLVIRELSAPHLPALFTHAEFF